jgi:shikimate 5-dehydrogenase
MLVEQGALAFQQWTGLDAPRSAMRAALTAFVQRRDDQSNKQHGG